MNYLDILNARERKYRIIWHITFLSLIFLKAIFVCSIFILGKFKDELCDGLVGFIIIYSLYFLINKENRSNYLFLCLIGWPLLIFGVLFGAYIDCIFLGLPSVFSMNVFLSILLSFLFLVSTWRFRKICKLIRREYDKP